MTWLRWLSSCAFVLQDGRKQAGWASGTVAKKAWRGRKQARRASGMGANEVCSARNQDEGWMSKRQARE
eukprot:354470-Chlamydomonas_euryale.AAC.5